VVAGKWHVIANGYFGDEHGSEGNEHCGLFGRHIAGYRIFFWSCLGFDLSFISIEAH